LIFEQPGIRARDWQTGIDSDSDADSDADFDTGFDAEGKNGHPAWDRAPLNQQPKTNIQSHDHRTA
jgi:hypothetical protein